MYFILVGRVSSFCSIASSVIAAMLCGDFGSVLEASAFRHIFAHLWHRHCFLLVCRITLMYGGLALQKLVREITSGLISFRNLPCRFFRVSFSECLPWPLTLSRLLGNSNELSARHRKVKTFCRSSFLFLPRTSLFILFFLLILSDFRDRFTTAATLDWTRLTPVLFSSNKFFFSSVGAFLTVSIVTVTGNRVRILDTVGVTFKASSIFTASLFGVGIESFSFSFSSTDAVTMSINVSMISFDICSASLPMSRASS